MKTVNKSANRFRLLPFACCVVFGFWVTPARADGLRAGAARIDVTPAQPVALAGYASRTNLSQGVHDPLSARALAFEQDGSRLVLVSLDSLGLYNHADKDWIPEPVLMATLLGEEVARVSDALSATNNHCPIKTAIETIEIHFALTSCASGTTSTFFARV